MHNYLKNAHSNIDYDPANNTLMLTWHRFASDEDFRSTMTKFYDLSQEKGVKKWFFDSRKQGMVSPDDQKWTISEITNRKFDTTAIKTAVVMPENLFMEVSVKKISNGLEQQAEATTVSETFQQFGSPEEALNWLNR